MTPDLTMLNDRRNETFSSNLSERERKKRETTLLRGESLKLAVSNQQGYMLHNMQLIPVLEGGKRLSSYILISYKY